MGVGADLYMYDVVVKSLRSLSHLLMSSNCCFLLHEIVEMHTVARSVGIFSAFEVSYKNALYKSTVIGSRPSDHYFSSVCLFVCLSVCLFVCAEFFSAVFDPISIKQGRTLYVWV